MYNVDGNSWPTEWADCQLVALLPRLLNRVLPLRPVWRMYPHGAGTMMVRGNRIQSLGWMHRYPISSIAAVLLVVGDDGEVGGRVFRWRNRKQKRKVGHTWTWWDAMWV